MGLEIQKPTKDDMPELVELFLLAFENDPSTNVLFKKRPVSEGVKQWYTALRAKGDRAPNLHTFIVRDTDTGEIVSESSWSIEEQKESEERKELDDMDLHEDLHEEYWAVLREADESLTHKHMGSQPFVHFLRLRTHPKHERRGAGGMLLKKCLAQAASLHLPTYLNATPKGMPLYRKYGFQTLEEYELEYMKDLNLAEPYINYCMLAPAPSTFAPAPSTAPLPVVVRPLPITYDSMIKVNKLYDAAFGVTELTRICFGAGAPRDPNGPSEAEMSAGRAEWALKILRSKPHAFRYDAAYDAKSGAILGVAKWYHVDDPFAEHWPNGRPEDRPSRGNKEASDAMFGELKRRREAMFRAEGRGVSYSYMSLLIVDPAAQRRGVGSALLRQGLSAIDERGEECFVDASPAGLGLYQKFGWKEVTQVTLDLTRYGGEGSETSVGLIRPVGGSTGS